MKNNKLFSFLRSMRFGMILLCAIAALSVVGTMVTQGQSAAFYTENYGNLGNLILFFGFDHMYATWYYVALFAALCLNLLLCSVLRFGKVKNAKAALIARVQNAKPQENLDAAKAEAACKKLGFKPVGEGVYVRRTLGLYGSFITHVGMLLLVIAAALVFSLEKKEDVYVMVGDTATLSDGCSVTVNAFSMENAEGKLDYISDITVTGKDGKPQEMTATVNYPARFEDHTVYQQNYAFAGVLDVQTAQDAPAEQIVLDSASFISLDGVSGVHYMQVYGNHTLDENGQIMPARAMGMENPAYLMAIITPEGQHMGMTLPDETFEVAGVYYTFREPEAYPGLSVKTLPEWVIPVLYASFAVLVLGLYLCFFSVPAALYFAEGKVRIASGKDASDVIEQLKDKIEETEE